MKVIMKSFLISALLLSGCVAAKLVFNIDPALDKNSKIYKVKSPKTLSDNRLNVSFGIYQVVNADSGMNQSESKFIWESHWITRIEDIRIQNSQKTKVTLSHTYRFKIGNKSTWDAQCVLVAAHRKAKVKKKMMTQILPSHYSCQFMQAGKKSWFLTITQNDFSGFKVRLTDKQKVYLAQVTPGIFKKSDGSTQVMFAPSDMGYTWIDRKNNKIGAVSIKETPPRVWLRRKNPDTVNDILSMASAGLIVYSWGVAPTLKW